MGILAEGDSWFSYPRKYLLTGPDINLLHHLRRKISGNDSANLLIRSSNGDEAVAMLSGKQKFSLAKVLEQNANHIDLILFSGGGNDLVGRYDMDRLLKPYKAGYSAQDCVRQQALDRKLKQVELAYTELLDIRNTYAPSAVVITHTYDYVQPSEKGAELLKFYKTGPWILPFLEEKNIPSELHAEISDELLGQLKTRLQKLATKTVAKNKFLVIDTQGILRRGHGTDWLNEIHPTASGFKRLFNPIYTAMRLQAPTLPK